MKILYYISGHGMGHATRSVALIDELKKNADVIIKTSVPKKYFKKALPKIKIISGIIDMGSTIKNDGISINKTKTIINQKRWINEIEKRTNIEKRIITKINPDLVISDVSVMPLVAAKKAKKKSICISNFSWYDVFDFIPKNDRRMLKNYYDNADFAFRLPFGTNMNHFKNIEKVDLVARIPKKSRKELRKKLGIKKNQKLITLSFGNSQKKIGIKFADDIKIVSLGANMKNDNIINIPKEIGGHELVSASDLVICKCGYGFVSECVSNQIPFLTTFSKNHNEQVGIINELRTFGYNKTVDFIKINDLQITKEFIKSIKPIKKIPIGNYIVSKRIIECIRD